MEKVLNHIFRSSKVTLNKNDVKSFHLDRENIEYFKIQILGLSCEIANIWIN
jgi:hypothetical protein